MPGAPGKGTAVPGAPGKGTTGEAEPNPSNVNVREVRGKTELDPGVGASVRYVGPGGLDKDTTE